MSATLSQNINSMKWLRKNNRTMTSTLKKSMIPRNSTHIKELYIYLSWSLESCALQIYLGTCLSRVLREQDLIK